MIGRVLVITCALALPASTLAAQHPSVRIEPPQLQGSRPIEDRTREAVIRDYLESWQTMQTALDRNQAAILDTSFVGTARDKLANTIAEQAKLGIHSRYRASSHDLQFVFYSPEGSSIQMIDTVNYKEQVLDHGKVLATKPVHGRYIVVLTPSEVRWRVRILQFETR